MEHYEVYLANKEDDIVKLTADDWSISSSQLYFYIEKEAIAVFQLDNICGFMRTEGDY